MHKKPSQSSKDTSCLNCAYPFSNTENFCPECGQKNKGKNLNLKDFIQEVFAGFFSWDAKFWRTLTPLLFKPGRVSKEYTQGKRARFTNPFRFFFIISILFFFLVKTKSSDAIKYNEGKPSETKHDSISHATIFKKDIGKYIAFQKKHPKLKTEIALDSLNEEKTFLNKLFYKKAKTINDFNNDSEDTSNKLLKLSLSYLSTAFLLLLPVFAFFFKLLYIRGNHNYMAHLIFIFHVSTFFFISLSAHQLLLLIPFTEQIIKNKIFIIISCFIVFGAYPFIAMKSFYQQSNLKTFFKLLTINIVFSFLILITISLIFTLAFIMM